MLTELKLSNFRIFDDEVTVRFRPITVLIGRNSSGKSSIVKFLLMLQQSAEYGRSQFLTPEGGRVSLGAFRSLKNSITKKRSLEFELSASSLVRASSWLRAWLSGSSETGVSSSLRFKVHASVRYSSRAGGGKSRFSVEDSFDENQIFAFDIRHLEDSSFWSYPRRTVFDRFVSWQRNDAETPGGSAERTAALGQAVDEFEKRSAEFAIVDNLRYQVNSIRHLSPVRSEAQRVIIASPPPVDDVGQGGEFALPHLQQLISSSGEGYEFIRPHLEKVAGIESIRFRTSAGYVSQAFARNKTTGADALIADFGFGVGQCLPILVQGAIMAPQTTLMVEQPEAQLHPTAQLDLGSFFADLWTKRQVGSIIESHSDNILLRLRRLIARGDLSHEDVSVAYFTFDEDNGNMPTVNNLDINVDGTMQPGLPMEFFGRNVIEGIQLGARK